MPLKLDDGWNQIQLNLTDLTRRAYGTNYVETLRVQVHANCRLRRIYFSDRLYSEEELPPEFKLYLPMQQQVSFTPALKDHNMQLGFSAYTIIPLLMHLLCLYDGRKPERALEKVAKPMALEMVGVKQSYHS